MQRECAGAGGSEFQNVVCLPGVTLPVPGVGDPDLLIASARQIEGVALHAKAVREALPPGAPTSVAERLAAIVGQLETLASLVEADVLQARGVFDVA